MILNTKRIHNSFKEILIIGNSKWVRNHIFALNYLTLLVYTQTIFHLSVRG